MKIYDISRDVMTTPPYPGDPAPILKERASFEQNGYTLSAIGMSVHTGTHIDAPRHFIRDGADIASMDITVFYGPCTVLTVPPRSLDAMYFMNRRTRERVLLRGEGTLTGSGIGYLYNSGVKLVGTDRNSIGSPGDEYSAHTALLGYGVAVLENVLLDNVPDGDYLLSAAPVKIGGAEGAPCRALLIEP